MIFSSVLGALVWAALVVGADLGRIERLCLLAPLVAVPLALHAIEDAPRLRALRVLQPAAALAVAASFLGPAGVLSAALAAGWLGLTLLLAERGLERLRSCRRWDFGEIAIDSGLLMVPVGGGWLVLSRLGATPMGFGEPIVLLTAAHFHYAAFVTLVLVGLAGRVLESRPAYRACVLGCIAGPPLLAAGITLSHAVEMLGAAVLTLSLWTFAVLCLRHLVPRREGAARAFVIVSTMSLLPSMLLDVAYAWGQLTRRTIVSLPDVALVHGTLNALGFGLAGLLAAVWDPRHLRPESR
jgi:hypothetical protein